MSIERVTSSDFVERKIITGLVTSSEFIERVRPIWSEEVIEAPEMRRIARWCFAYYEQYQSAPGQDIAQVYMAAIQAESIPKAEAELIEGILQLISDEYAEKESQINVDYLTDQTVTYFRKRRLEHHREQITDLVEVGRLDDAEALARNFTETAPGKRLVEWREGKMLLAKELEPPKMLVSGILPAGVIVLAGPPKLGKSLLALHLCLAVSGWFKEEKGRVIPRRLRFLGRTVERGHSRYFDLEGNEQRLQTRMRKFIGDRRIDVSGFRYAFEAPTLRNGFSLELEDTPRGDPRLRLVVIDIWEKILSHKSGNDRDPYHDSVTDIGEIQRLANKYRVTILIVHHTNKNPGAKGVDKILGSTGLAGSVDTPVVFTPVPNEGGAKRGRLEISSRDCEQSDLLIEQDPESLIWNSLGEYRIEKADKPREVEDWLSSVLKDEPLPARQVERLARESGHSMAAVQRAAKRLGVKKGKSGYQGTWQWAMPEKG